MQNHAPRRLLEPLDGAALLFDLHLERGLRLDEALDVVGIPPRQPPAPGQDGVGCGKGRNDTLSVEGPLFVVPRSFLHEAFPTNTSLS